jgi:hypothetical protein
MQNDKNNNQSTGTGRNDNYGNNDSNRDSSTASRSQMNDSGSMGKDNPGKGNTTNGGDDMEDE